MLHTDFVLICRHMDGNHKLIRWNFVAHGCIDGYFRTVVYLQTVTVYLLSHFQEAILRFRCPLRIRSDYGTENIEVARWLLNHHGVHTKPFLAVLSIYNQRIERLWLDVRVYVLQQLTNLLRFYENIDVLHPVNVKHLFAYQYVFLPLINCTLEQFMETWNSHPMWTCGNISPHQIWTEGFYRSEFFDGDLLMSTKVGKSYGIDNERSVSDIQIQNHIEVPRVNINLTAQQLTYLHRAQGRRERTCIVSDTCFD